MKLDLKKRLKSFVKEKWDAEKRRREYYKKSYEIAQKRELKRLAQERARQKYGRVKIPKQIEMERPKDFYEVKKKDIW